MRRNLFWRLQGFPTQKMEDVLFSEQLRDYTTPVMLPTPVLTDARKFKQLGVWRALLYVLSIQLAHELKGVVGFERFFVNYR